MIRNKIFALFVLLMLLSACAPQEFSIPSEIVLETVSATDASICYIESNEYIFETIESDKKIGILFPGYYVYTDTMFDTHTGERWNYVQVGWIKHCK